MNDPDDEEDVKRFVQACNEDFPALCLLELHFCDSDASASKMIRALEELKLHPLYSLSS